MICKKHLVKWKYLSWEKLMILNHSVFCLLFGDICLNTIYYLIIKLCVTALYILVWFIEVKFVCSLKSYLPLNSLACDLDCFLVCFFGVVVVILGKSTPHLEHSCFSAFSYALFSLAACWSAYFKSSISSKNPWGRWRLPLIRKNLTWNRYFILLCSQMSLQSFVSTISSTVKPLLNGHLVLNGDPY